MKTAIVHDWLTGMRGGEKCLEVFCELFPEADLFTLLHVQGKMSPVIEAMKIHTSFLQHIPGVFTHYRYFLPLMPCAIERFDLSGYDLVLSSSHCVAKGVRTEPKTCHVCYCHTPMRYAWDQADQYFNQDRQNLVVRSMIQLILSRLRLWDRATADRVDFFVANSKNVADRIRRIYGRESEIIHAPVSDLFFQSPGQQVKETGALPLKSRPGEYYLIVSAFAPYKRLDIALSAFRNLPFPLVVVGTGQDQARIQAEAGPNVEFLGWVSDDKLKTLYEHCKALIFPGEEDFGITPLEAMACGKPVIAFGRGGVTETVIPLDPDSEIGPDPATGLFFQTQTPEAVRESVLRFEGVSHLFREEVLRSRAQKFGTARFREAMKKFITTQLKEYYNR